MTSKHPISRALWCFKLKGKRVRISKDILEQHKPLVFRKRCDCPRLASRKERAKVYDVHALKRNRRQHVGFSRFAELCKCQTSESRRDHQHIRIASYAEAFRPVAIEVFLCRAMHGDRL